MVRGGGGDTAVSARYIVITEADVLSIRFMHIQINFNKKLRKERLT